MFIFNISNKIIEILFKIYFNNSNIFKYKKLYKFFFFKLCIKTKKDKSEI